MRTFGCSARALRPSAATAICASMEADRSQQSKEPEMRQTVGAARSIALGQIAMTTGLITVARLR